MTAAAPTMRPRHELPAYSVLVEFMDAPVRVLWNDWPIAEREERGFENVLVNPFVIEGTNVLSVLVGPLAEPTDQWISLSVNRGHVTEDSALATPIFSLRWTPAQGYSKTEWVEIARHEIHVREAFGRWRWQDARPYRLEDEPAARAHVARLHDLLSRKDIDGFLELCGPKIDELARATGRRPEMVAGVQKHMLKGLLDDPNVTILPLEPRELEFVSGAGGKLVAARCLDGTSPLRTEDGQAELRIVLSHLESGFEIVR